LHVHCSFAINDPSGLDAVSEGPGIVGRAALIGGTTTLIDFPWKGTEESIRDATARIDGEWHGTCPSDYSFHVVLRGVASGQTLAEIPGAIQAGYPSFKLSTTNVFRHNVVGDLPLKAAVGSITLAWRST
jgi:Dihydroorotase and related cyclic amidohydrolases